jgi:inner membrane protein
MSPVTHFFTGWLLAAVSPNGKPTTLNRREKTLVVAAAVAPDLDGLGIVPEILTRHSAHPLLWFSQYHHSLHTLAFALVVTLVALLLSARTNRAHGQAVNGQQPRLKPSRPWTTALLVFLSFHLHLLCDLIGARGPDGDQWPIPYLLPFSNALQLTWHGQWALNAWQNFVITGVLLLVTFWTAWRHGSSPVELVSEKWNRKLAEALRSRFR